MWFPILKTFRLVVATFLAVFFLTVLFVSSSSAQIPNLLQKSDQQAPSSKGSSGREISAPELRKELQSVSQQLAALEKLQQTASPEQLGATTDEIAEKFQMFNQQALNLNRHLDALQSIEENTKAQQELENQIQGWKGFPNAPPYPLSLLDELRDSIDSESAGVEKTEVEISLFRQELDRARDTLKASEKELRQVREQVEGETDDSEKLRNGWLLDLATVKNKTAETRVLSLSSQVQEAEQLRQIHLSRRDFLQRKLDMAVSGGAVFPKEELDTRLAAISEEQKKTEREQDRSTEVQENVRKALDNVRGEIDLNRRALIQSPHDQDLENRTKELEDRLDLLKTQSDTTELKAEMLKIWNYALALEKLFWEERFRVWNNHSGADLKAIAESLGQRLERIQEFRSYLSTQVKLAQNLALTQRNRMASEDVSELEKGRIARKQEVFQERVNFLLDFQPKVDDLERQIRKFRDEVAELRGRATLTERLTAFSGRLENFFRGVWDFEILTVEDTLIVEGQAITQQTPVTISKVVRALLILGLGIWGAILLTGRINRWAEKILKVSHGAAVLIDNLFILILVLFVFVFAMATVKIPLTVFAFLGGALAIGVGFGAQNVINNFISGIILLLEQPIRVGDVVEIDGTRGRVTNIGGRCSQVRRFDGVDILVPNSEFLQKSVVNLTHSDDFLRLDVKVGVAYGSPTREVSKIISAALEEHGKILKNPEPVILFEDFGDSALIFSVYFWVEQSPKADYRIIPSDFRHMLDRRFRDAGITIAFPQLDVHLDSAEPLRLRLEKRAKEEATGKTDAPEPENTPEQESEKPKT